MPCACIIPASTFFPLPHGQPAGSSQRNCLLSGDGPPTANPPDITFIWIYRDNLTGIWYPWNPQTALWLELGTGLGGAGLTTRACCSLMAGSGAPASNPPDTVLIWFYLDVQNGVVYQWNPETLDWDIGGAGSGNNNGMYWGNGAPVNPPANIYVNNVYLNLDNGLVYWWDPFTAAWE